MNTHLLLAEGTSGTGKTTLLRGLLTKYVLEEEKPRTLLYLTQAHTYFPLVARDHPTPMDKRQHREHLRKILRMLQWDTEGLAPRKRFILYGLLDTLHLTQYFRPGTLSWSEMGYVDQQLAGLGGRMIFLRATPETLWERITDERDKESAHRYYVKQQDDMERLARRSALTTLFLRAEEPPADLLNKAYAFWLEEKR